MSKQLDMFKTNLEEFASKHKQEIRKNPEFRVQFQDMCATIGVDPLACKELSVGVCVLLGFPRDRSCLVVVPAGTGASSRRDSRERKCVHRVPSRTLSAQFDGEGGEAGMQAEEPVFFSWMICSGIFLWPVCPFIKKYLVLMKIMCDHAINKGEKRNRENRSLLSP